MIPRGFRATPAARNWPGRLCLLLGFLAVSCSQPPVVPQAGARSAPPAAPSPAGQPAVTAGSSAAEPSASPSPAATSVEPGPARQELAFVRDGDIWLATADGSSALRL